LKESGRGLLHFVVVLEPGLSPGERKHDFECDQQKGGDGFHGCDFSSAVSGMASSPGSFSLMPNAIPPNAQGLADQPIALDVNDL
jgi:hypothetical protein